MHGHKKLALCLIATIASSAIHAAESTPRKLGYGSRAGMEVTVISVDGLDTSRAVIRTKHTREDAIAFCREYVGKVTEACIREELATALKDNVTADCNKREFVNLFGERYRFEGPASNRSRDVGTPDYRLRNLKTGELADGSMASGYPINMEIFRTLCPSAARGGSPQASTSDATESSAFLAPKELDQVRRRYARDVNFPKQYMGRSLMVTGTAAATNPRSSYRVKIQMPRRGGEDVVAWCSTTTGPFPVGASVTVAGILSGDVYTHDEGGEAFYLTECTLKSVE